MPYPRKDLLTWQAGMYYHIYNRGVSKTTLFREAANYIFVLEKLQKYRKECQVSIIAYCLMPNHYHLLLRQDGDIPAGKVPQLVFNSYTKAYNAKYEHSGTLFEGRFRAKQAQSDSYLSHLCRYIHGNPVKDGLVDNPADWPWSNYLDWIGERNGSLVDRDFIIEHFDNPRRYNEFLFEYLESYRLPEGVKQFLNELEK